MSIAFGAKRLKTQALPQSFSVRGSLHHAAAGARKLALSFRFPSTTPHCKSCRITECAEEFHCIFSGESIRSLHCPVPFCPITLIFGEV